MFLKTKNHSPSELNHSKSHESYACGKAIIVGEHAAIHGAKAIAIPLKNLQVRLKINEHDNKLVTSFADNVGDKIKDQNFSFELSKLLKRALELIREPFSEIPIQIESNIIIGSGLGSSAALCVSLVRFLSSYFNKKYDAIQVAQLANELEKIFHGNPSGLDTTVISYEKPVVYQKGTPPSFIQVKPLIVKEKESNWPFILIDTGERSPTYLMVEKTKPFFMGADGNKRVKVVNQMADEVIHAFEKSDFETMVSTLNQASKSLEELGIVTKRSKEISDRARELGVPAIKVTGSGGGGCLLALLNPEQKEQQFLSLVENFGHDKVFKIFL